MVVLFKCVGKELSVPDAVIVRFKSTASRKYRYDQDRSFTVTADSKKFDLGQLELTNSERDTSSRGIGGFYYEETLEKVIKLEDYARIVAAKKVEIIVGETNFRLSQKDINSLRSYLERLKS